MRTSEEFFSNLPYKPVFLSLALYHSRASSPGQTLHGTATLPSSLHPEIYISAYFTTITVYIV